MGVAGLLLLVAALSAVAGQVRDKPSDYPVSLKADEVEYGAEYLVRSIPYNGQTIVNEGYLVVEIAVFPPKGKQILVTTQAFELRINGARDVLHAQTPGIVAAAVKYPDWETRPELQVGAGMGDRGIILGRRPPVERFPGDNRPASTRLPRPVPSPDTRPAGVDPGAPPVTPDQMVTASALPEGACNKPVAGHVYFAYRGKAEKIRTVELLVRTSSGGVVSARLR